MKSPVCKLKNRADEDRLNLGLNPKYFVDLRRIHGENTLRLSCGSKTHKILDQLHFHEDSLEKLRLKMPQLMSCEGH